MQFPEKLQKTVRKHRDIKLVTIEIMNYLVSEPNLSTNLIQQIIF